MDLEALVTDELRDDAHAYTLEWFDVEASTRRPPHATVQLRHARRRERPRRLHRRRPGRRDLPRHQRRHPARGAPARVPHRLGDRRPGRARRGERRARARRLHGPGQGVSTDIIEAAALAYVRALVQRRAQGRHGAPRSSPSSRLELTLDAVASRAALRVRPPSRPASRRRRVHQARADRLDRSVVRADDRDRRRRAPGRAAASVAATAALRLAGGGGRRAGGGDQAEHAGAAAGGRGVEVRRAPHAAVDVLAAADLHRREHPRHRARGQHRLGDGGAAARRARRTSPGAPLPRSTAAIRRRPSKRAPSRSRCVARPGERALGPRRCRAASAARAQRAGRARRRASASGVSGVAAPRRPPTPRARSAAARRDGPRRLAPAWTRPPPRPLGRRPVARLAAAARRPASPPRSSPPTCRRSTRTRGSPAPASASIPPSSPRIQASPSVPPAPRTSTSGRSIASRLPDARCWPAARLYVITYKRMAAAAEPTVAAVGPRVKALREAMDLSLRDLAERSGVSRADALQVERGETSPTLQVAARIAAGLELRLSQLLRLDEDGTVTVVRARRAPQRRRRRPRLRGAHPAAARPARRGLPPHARTRRRHRRPGRPADARARRPRDRVRRARRASRFIFDGDRARARTRATA